MKVEITQIVVHVKVGMSYSEALKECKYLAQHWGCEVIIPDFNGERVVVTEDSNLDQMVADYLHKALSNGSTLGL